MADSSVTLELKIKQLQESLRDSKDLLRQFREIERMRKMAPMPAMHMYQNLNMEQRLKLLKREQADISKAEAMAREASSRKLLQNEMQARNILHEQKMRELAVAMKIRNLEHAEQMRVKGAADSSARASLWGEMMERNYNHSQKMRPGNILRQMADMAIPGMGRVGQFEEIFSLFKLLPGPLKAVAIAVAGFAAALTASKHFMEAGMMGLMTGGTGYESARLQGLFGAFGMGGRESAVAAGRITERLAEDAKAMQWAARMGVHYRPGPYGERDEAATILKVIDGLGKLQGAQRTQAAYAIAGGRNEMFAQLMLMSQLSPQAKMGLKFDAFANAGVYTPGANKRGTEMQVEWNRLLQSLKRLFDAVIEPLIPIATVVLRALADQFTFLALVVKTLLFPLNVLLHMITDPVGYMTGGWKDDLPGAMSDNTKAVSENTVELRKGREVFGKGAFADSAIPAGFRGMYLSKIADPQAIGLGFIG